MPDPDTSETPEDDDSSADDDQTSADDTPESGDSDDGESDSRSDNESDSDSDQQSDDGQSDESGEASGEDSQDDEPDAASSDVDSSSDDDAGSDDSSGSSDGNASDSDDDSTSADDLQNAGADADANAGAGNVGDTSAPCTETETANLGVRLVHLCDQSPLNGGTVTISGPQSSELTTGTDGYANFKNIAPGNYQIKGIHPQHQPGTTTGNAPAGVTSNVTLALQGLVKIAAVKNEYTVVLDKTGATPASFPILQFQITNGPPNHLFDIQLSRGGAGDLTGGPGLGGSWKEADGRDARVNRTKFSSWTNGQTTLSTDASGNATYTMPLEWWRDQARQPRASFTDFTYVFRVITFKAGPTAVCSQSSADGSGSASSVILHNNLTAFRVTDNGWVSGGLAHSIGMEFSVREANTTEMYTFVQWMQGSFKRWHGAPPVLTHPTHLLYDILHIADFPDFTIDRLHTNPRYRDDNYSITDGGKKASSDDAPSGGGLAAADSTGWDFIDFETRVHLNFEIPAAVTVTRKDGSAPVFGVVSGKLADPQPIKLDSGNWNTRVLQLRQADGTVAVTHPNTYAGP